MPTACNMAHRPTYLYLYRFCTTPIACLPMYKRSILRAFTLDLSSHLVVKEVSLGVPKQGVVDETVLTIIGLLVTSSPMMVSTTVQSFTVTVS